MTDNKLQADVNDSPVRSAMLSTRTSSFEALDPHDPNLSHLATTMFKKTGDYLNGEISSIQDTYENLEAMNVATRKKYSNYKPITDRLAANIVNHDKTYAMLLPFMEKIDDIEETVLKLEKTARALDSYTKQLEMKYKQLKK